MAGNEKVFAMAGYSLTSCPNKCFIENILLKITFAA
jgi:hypothetical protein